MEPQSLMTQDPIDDIIGRTPAWMVRFGISLVFIIVALLGSVTWMIKYPHTLEARITLSSERPPAEVVSKTGGAITKLFVHDHEMTPAGAPLAMLDNTADFETMSELSEQMRQFSRFFDNPLAFPDISWKKDAQLGDAQSAYLDFIRALEEYHVFRASAASGDRVAAMQSQKDHYDLLQTRLQRQVRIATAKLAFETETLNRSRRLVQRDMLARTDLIEVEKAYLERKEALEEAKITVARNRIHKAEIDQQLADYQSQQSRQEAALVAAVKVAYKRLRHALDEWRTRYVLTAPVAGRVAFHKFWSRDQYVAPGKVIMSIVAEATEIIGKMYLPQYGIGKLQTGQRVDVRLDSYPHTEFGRVVGRVALISPLAIQEGYMIHVDFADGLTTTYRQRLPFTHNMQGQAQVLTQERRLIERIFEHFRYLFRR